MLCSLFSSVFFLSPQLKDVSECADVGRSLDTGSQGELLKYGCIVELSLPQHGVTCCGVGVAENVVDQEKGERNLVFKHETIIISHHHNYLIVWVK